MYLKQNIRVILTLQSDRTGASSADHLVINTEEACPMLQLQHGETPHRFAFVIFDSQLTIDLTLSCSFLCL